MRQFPTLFLFALLSLNAGACDSLAAAAQPSRPVEEPVPTALRDYVTRPEPAFAWAIKDRSDHPDSRRYQVEFTSHSLTTLVWTH